MKLVFYYLFLIATHPHKWTVTGVRIEKAFMRMCLLGRFIDGTTQARA